MMASFHTTIHKGRQPGAVSQQWRPGEWWHLIANSANPGWGGLISLALHGALLLMPAHLFWPPEVKEPVSGSFIMVASAPAIPETDAVRSLPSPPPELPLPEPLVAATPEPPPATSDAESGPEPVLTATATPVLRPKIKPKPAVIPKPVIPRSIASSRSQPPAAPTFTAPSAVFESSRATAAPLPVTAPARDPFKAVAKVPIETVFGADGGPRFKRRVRTRYPRLAQLLGYEGTVILRLTIDAAGLLDDVEVIGATVTDLADAAILAVRASTFFPAMRDGLPVASRAILPIRFKLKE